MKKVLLAVLVMCWGGLSAQNGLKLRADNIDEVMKNMTLDEKVWILLGGGDADIWSYYNKQGEILLSGQGAITTAIPRLGIMSTVFADGPAGLRIDSVQKAFSNPAYCTAFPSATALASSWNRDIVTKVGQSIGKESLEYGADVLLGPGMNIQRNPLTGRNFEYYSEDPVVTGEMAAAMVNGIQSNGVGACLKHFAANNIESNRRTINAEISQRALREIYLRGFQIAVRKSQPWMIMSSYNKLNGYYTAESKELLTDVLRGEWGYKGAVMTDWVSGMDYIAQVRSGNDMFMPGYYQHKTIVDAVNRGELDQSTLDRNVRRVLEYIVKTPTFKGYKKSYAPDIEKHSAVSREAASESMVLLKNDKNTLPLKKVRNVALFGKTSYHFIAGGTGSGRVNNKYTVSLLQGLANSKIGLSAPVRDFYQNYNDSIVKFVKPTKRIKAKNVIDFAPEASAPRSLISQSLKGADMAIITIGRNAGEHWDRSADRYFNLSDNELAMIKNVCEVYHAAGKKVVVVLNIGGPIEIASWKDLPDAILLSWQTGQEGGNALADILCGRINPSGKLAVTFPAKYADVPSAGSFPGVPADNPENAYYEEGIYVGYRYYQAFEVIPAYEFGYGLSYTTFEYSAPKLSSTTLTNKIEVSVTVKNTGKVAGKEVVQLYVIAPKTILEKPEQELRGFAKTGLLKPGESETLRFELEAFDLASFYPGKSAWIADKGEYKVLAGASSHDIRTSATFTINEDVVTEKVGDVLYPNIRFKELSIYGAHELFEFPVLLKNNPAYEKTTPETK